MREAPRPATIALPALRHAIAVLAGIALAAASLAACAARTDPSGPVSSPGQQAAELYAVVTGNDVNALVGIDVARRTVTQLAVIEQNRAEFDAFSGGPISRPPVSVVLSDSIGGKPLVWTQNPGANTLAVRAFDRTTGELRDIAVDRPGVQPFLADGRLGWVSAPRDGNPRLIAADGSFEIDLPGVSRVVVPGPGPGRVTALVDLDFQDLHLLVVDVAQKTVTDLRIEPLHIEGVWAGDTTLVVAAYGRIEPTPQDPENGEPDNRILTWSIDDGSNPDAVAGLVEGPTLRTAELYPALVTGGDGLLAVITGSFDRPWVEVFDLDSDDPPRRLDLTAAEFVTAMAVSGTTLVVLQNRHVTFIDLSSGERTIVDLGGVTGTTWVGP